MKLQLEGLNLEVTDYHKDLVAQKLAQKLDQLLQSFKEDLKLLDVKLREDENWGYTAKATLSLADHQLHAEAKGEELVNAVVDLREKLEQQIEHFISKLERR